MSDDFNESVTLPFLHGMGPNAPPLNYRVCWRSPTGRTGHSAWMLCKMAEDALARYSAEFPSLTHWIEERDVKVEK